MQQFVSQNDRTPTFLYYLSVAIDILMKREEIGAPGNTYWALSTTYGFNSGFGTFLRQNFPKDHRIWNHLSVVRYAGPETSTVS